MKSRMDVNTFLKRINEGGSISLSHCWSSSQCSKYLFRFSFYIQNATHEARFSFACFPPHPFTKHPSCPCISLHPPALLQAGGQGRLKAYSMHPLLLCHLFKHAQENTQPPPPPHPTIPFTAAYCTHSRPKSGGRRLCPPKLTRKQK